MKITPIDIAHKNFSRKMLGLDEVEVGHFLQQVSSAMESLIHERNSLKELVREKELQINDFKERDHVFKSTLSTAGQMAERHRADAEREAKLIVADAHQRADLITRDSRDSLKKIYQEVTDLKRMRIQFEANLKALAQAHLSLVEQGEKFMPSIGLPNTHIENENPSNRNSAISPLSAR